MPSENLALGETSSTAYAGDKGKALADRLTTAEANIASNDGDITAFQNRATKLEDGTTPAGKATKLATARKISISGDATGNTTFDGSADKAIAFVYLRFSICSESLSRF
ncbi:MAG: hypothetical protein SPH86_04215 [Eubacteriales bacterium]|nr:hypothetical protein [Eubacteriales bacterium]MDY6151371.1 hypothetical protein [Eubacteriales bacterium]